MQALLTALQTAPRPFSRRAAPVGSKRRARLIENVQLESTSLRPSIWAYPPGAPAHRGENLNAAALAEATRRLDAHAEVRRGGLSYATLLQKAGEALNPIHAGSCNFFFRSAQPPAALSGTIWNVCSVNALRFSFAGAGSASMRAAYDWMTSPTPSILPVQPSGGRIGLGPTKSSFWLSDESPLDLLAGRGVPLGSQDAAWTILQELAIPGFETRRRREEAMGLIAIQFPADCLQASGFTASAWKPTAIDALNFKGYCFLPGRTADQHGLTWPLARSLRKHQPRDGLREFVHPHIAVPALAAGARTVHLLGFFDAAAEATWNRLSPP